MLTPDEEHGTNAGPITWDDVMVFQEELKNSIRSLLAREGYGKTIKTTALLVSVFRRLQGAHKDWGQNPHREAWPDWSEVTWENREVFLKHARQAMRQAMVDAARERRRRAEYQMADFQSATLAPLIEAGALSLQRMASPEMSEKTEAIVNALAIMERDYPDLAAIIQHTYLDGWTQAEIGQLLGFTDRTVRNKLLQARVTFAELVRQALLPGGTLA